MCLVGRLPYFEHLYELGDRDYRRLGYLAWEYVRGKPEARRNLKLALERARQAVAAKPDYGEAWDTIAVALLDGGELEEALKAAEKAVDLKDIPEHQETLDKISMLINNL